MAEGSASYQEMVEQVGDHAVFLIDRESRVRTWNEGVLNVLGYSEKEFVGLDARRLFTPEDQAARVPERELAQAEANGRSSDDRWLLRKDGSRFWAAGTTSAIRAPNGACLGFSKIFRDATSMRTVQDELRSAEERFRLAAKACSDLIYERHFSDDTIEWFGDLDSALGYEPREGPRTVAAWSDAIHPDDRDRVLLGFRRQVESHVPFEEEYRIRRKEGRYSVWNDRGTVVEDASGQAIKWIGVITDLTEKRRLEDQLHQAQRLESLGRLAGGVAHDLNNMLVAILGYTDFVARSLPAADRRRADLDQVSKAATRSATLTRQLLAFARREMIRPTHVDLDALVRDMERMLQSVAGDRIELVTTLAGGGALVYADRSQLEQLILGLALNARDAMPHGGRLALQTGTITVGDEASGNYGMVKVPAGSYAQVMVSDTGQGMDRDTLAHIFEPFFTTKPMGEATGLGLASVYGAVKQNGGFIWVYSEPGHGSVFKIYLPLVSGTGDPVEPTAASPPRPATGTILVVEDEGATAEANCRALEAQGFHCIRANDAPEALRILTDLAGRVDLVLLDVVLPSMTGLQFGGHIAMLSPKLPVLYTSGFTVEDVTRRGLIPPSKPFLQKPYHPAELVARVVTLLSAPDRG